MTNPHHPKPWHRGSVFGDGYRCPLDREKRARFRYLLNAWHRGGRLTRGCKPKPAEFPEVFCFK